jgi:hypothetical protein
VFQIKCIFRIFTNNSNIQNFFLFLFLDLVLFFFFILLILFNFIFLIKNRILNLRFWLLVFNNIFENLILIFYQFIFIILETKKFIKFMKSWSFFRFIVKHLRNDFFQFIRNFIIFVFELKFLFFYIFHHF